MLPIRRNQHPLPIQRAVPGAKPGGWQNGYIYLQRGLASARRGPGLYLQILVAYAAPALLAGYLAATVPKPGFWEQVAILGLPWITIVLGTVVVMIAIGHHARGQPVGLGRASWEALLWVPRYLWTNAHTGTIFWVPVGLLIRAREWQEEALPLGGIPGVALTLLWGLAIGGMALYLHTRTLLAPFLAVHSDLPGTLAALEAWRLSGRYFVACFSTGVVASLPVALPLGLLGLGLVTTLRDTALVMFLAALPNLLWAGIQAVRPILIPALYVLYKDLWQGELARRRQEGSPPVPAFARVLLALTGGRL